MGEPGRTKRVTEQESLAYLRKAQEFHQTMVESYRAGRWNSAGLAGVHCAISAADALLGRTARVRSAGQDHHEVVRLLRRSVFHEGTAGQAQRLSRVLGQKNRVEYESRGFTEQEAASVLKDAGRFMEWVQSFFAG